MMMIPVTRLDSSPNSSKARRFLRGTQNTSKTELSSARTIKGHEDPLDYTEMPGLISISLLILDL